MIIKFQKLPRLHHVYRHTTNTQILRRGKFGMKISELLITKIKKFQCGYFVERKGDSRNSNAVD